MNAEQKNRRPKLEPPQLFAVHSVGKPIKPQELKKFRDGALSIADGGANEFPGTVVREMKWCSQ